jgi:hypothetical protein
MTLRNKQTGATLSLYGAAVPRGSNLDAYREHGWLVLSEAEEARPPRVA